MENETVKELNEFLKGEFMGIHAYEQYIENAEDASVKKTLQAIQQSHKKHAMTVAERIQNLGGKAVDDVGFTGSIQEGISSLKGFPKNKIDLIKGAMKGEELGSEMMEKFVRGDLDEVSKSMIQTILDEHERHRKLLAEHLED
ncbi:ferritin-like domain-containing protein [Bacillus sp. FJAT-45066]|uniref:ferritin-like domain-containing protein n=1 Tax=Bacillus sp. FJAT-45066 TaxID=2011010 RepID=UPI000BB98EEC|nr:ferritin-like domain-containing protein [Bacillus sp. FJAT-45066]